MKEYISTNVLNLNIEIRIKANYYSQAMDLLLSVTRNIDDYRIGYQNAVEMEQKKLSSVEFLAERYEYVSWMLKRDEIGSTTAAEWTVKYLQQAKEMHEQERQSFKDKHGLSDEELNYDPEQHKGADV